MLNQKTEIKNNRLKLLNILIGFSIGALSIYWVSRLIASSDLRSNDKDIISIIAAAVILILTTIIVVLLTYTTIKLFRGVYKEQIQKIAISLLIIFAILCDIFIVRFFAELSILSKIIFVYLHTIIIILAIFSFKKDGRV